MILKRFLIIVLAGVVLSFSLLAYLVIDHETSVLARSLQERAATYAGSVSTALKESMLQGTPDIARSIVYQLNKKGPLKVSVHKADGSIFFGDADGPLSPDAFNRTVGAMQTKNGGLQFIIPLLNEPQCHRCHSPGRTVLGGVVISMPMSSVSFGTKQLNQRLVMFGILLIVLTVGAAYLLAQKVMLDPIHRIHQGVEKMKRGEMGHRIDLHRPDELGSLAETFNQMAESIEKSRVNLEHAVRQKTNELRVIAELSSTIFRGEIPLPLMINELLDAIVSRMDFGYASLCLVDRETGLISREYAKGINFEFCSTEISLAGDHPFTSTIREARPTVKKTSEIGGPPELEDIVVIPVLALHRKRCREVNLCTREDCPAYSGDEERCWMVNGTLCRSPKAVTGKGKLFGCILCDAFPVMGVLIVGKREPITKSSLHSLEIMASLIASAIENQRLIDSKKGDIDNLVKLHNLSVHTFQSLGEELAKAVVSGMATFVRLDGALLLLKMADGRMRCSESFNIDRDVLTDALSAEDSPAAKSVSEGRPIESINIEDFPGLTDIVRRHNFTYAVFVPLKYKGTVSGCLALFRKLDYRLTDSEKAVLMLYAGQASAALNTTMLYEELSRREHSYRTLSENLPGIVYRLDADERSGILFFNDMLHHMTGFRAEELPVNDMLALGHLMLQEDRSAVLEVVKKALRDDLPFHIEYRIRHKEGEIHYLSEQGRPVIGPGGRIRHIDGVIFDITDRKQSEEKLKRLLVSLRSEQEFSEAIFNGAAEGIMVLDRGGTILKINKVGAAILGMNISELGGRMLTDRYPEAADMMTVAPIPGEREIVIVRGDESAVPIGFTSSPFFGTTEADSGTIVLFRNLSELKKLQAEFKNKDRFETISKVVSGVAHEVRNPLFGITSIGQILSKELGSPQHLSLIQAMLKEAERMKRLIEELLLYTRPSRFDIREVRLAGLLGEIDIVSKNRRREVALSVDVPDWITISVDRDKFVQVMLNLLNNAVDAARISVTISACQSDKDVNISVSDDGQGIKAADMPRIFDPFFTTKRAGTGLGLPICKKIVEDHGGSVEVRSVEGEGTTVTITLPGRTPTPS